MYELIKKYYELGIYNDSDIDMFVLAENITKEQGDEIKRGK